MSVPQRLQTDEEEVLAANRKFYAALHSLDMSQMAQVWSHEDWVRCLHPGWELLVGWDEVEGSWRQIFSATDQMMIAVSRVILHVSGNVAWVSCLENVTSAHQNDLSTSLVEATNIFERRNGHWLLVHHHTTPLGVPTPDASVPIQ